MVPVYQIAYPKCVGKGASYDVDSYDSNNIPIMGILFETYLHFTALIKSEIRKVSSYRTFSSLISL